jgi:hypothetical protein
MSVHDSRSTREHAQRNAGKSRHDGSLAGYRRQRRALSRRAEDLVLDALFTAARQPHRGRH